MHDRVMMWNNLVEHPNYDQYWQARNLLPHLEERRSRRADRWWLV